MFLLDHSLKRRPTAYALYDDDGKAVGLMTIQD